MTLVMGSYVMSHKVSTLNTNGIVVFGLGDSSNKPIFGRVLVSLLAGTVSGTG
jgi:hypothetical protein